MDEIDAQPGCYLLWLSLPNHNKVKIGKLGTFAFPAGDYLYVGSARGPGGLAARITRHLRPVNAKRQHWHIDWLLEAAQPIGVVWAYSTEELECAWAASLEALGDRAPARFGASDCGCKGHLLRLSASVSFVEVLLVLKRLKDGDMHGIQFESPRLRIIP